MSKRTKLFFAFTAIILLAFVVGCSSGADSKDFMKDAAQGGMSEVQLGNLAVQRAASDEVKRFGQRMVDDHTRANNELRQLAASKGVTLPTEVNSKQKSLYDKLSKLSGAEFDKEYISSMVDDHKEDVEEFQKQAQSGTDPDVKAWAAKTLPTLKEHLSMAEQIQNSLKK